MAIPIRKPGSTEKPERKPDPSPSFRFHIELQGLGIKVGRFTECSGLEFETKTFDYQEGGLNSRVHRLPTNFVYSNLTLKKGIALDGEPLWKWVVDAVKGNIRTHDITVILYDAGGKAPLRTWHFREAYPVKWSASALTAEQNAIAVETLVLAHQGLMYDGRG